MDNSAAREGNVLQRTAAIPRDGGTRDSGVTQGRRITAARGGGRVCRGSWAREMQCSAGVAECGWRDTTTNRDGGG